MAKRAYSFLQVGCKVGKKYQTSGMKRNIPLFISKVKEAKGWRKMSSEQKKLVLPKGMESNFFFFFFPPKIRLCMVMVFGREKERENHIKVYQGGFKFI